MKKKTVFIFFISIHLILFFLPRQATAFNNETFLESDKSESIEELFSKISSSFPHVSDEYAIELAEAIYLMNQLEREIFLTNEILELREKGEVYEEIPPLSIDELEPAEREEIISTRKEIVIARHISRDPEESLPREERSLLRELEERKEIERVTPLPREEAKVQAKEELDTLKKQWDAELVDPRWPNPREYRRRRGK